MKKATGRVTIQTPAGRGLTASQCNWPRCPLSADDAEKVHFICTYLRMCVSRETLQDRTPDLMHRIVVIKTTNNGCLYVLPHKTWFLQHSICTIDGGQHVRTCRFQTPGKASYKLKWAAAGSVALSVRDRQQWCRQKQGYGAYQQHRPSQLCCSPRVC